MSKGRTAPPRVIPALYSDDTHIGCKRAEQIDTAFFQDNPQACFYERAYIPGETPELLPAGTRVLVQRIGAQRIRSFVPPSVESN